MHPRLALMRKIEAENAYASLNNVYNQFHYWYEKEEIDDERLVEFKIQLSDILTFVVGIIEGKVQ